MAAGLLTFLLLVINIHQEVIQVYEESAHPCGDLSDNAIKTLWTRLMIDYDGETVPKPGGVDVEIELLLQAVNGISEISSSFVADFLFSQVNNYGY